MNEYQSILENLNHWFVCEWIDEYDWEDNNTSHFEEVKNGDEIKSLIYFLINKEIPKKLNNLNYNIFKEYDEYYVFGNCPSCGNRIDVSKENKPNCCPECGQKIDWSE